MIDNDELARELHDTLCQSLYAHTIDLRSRVATAPELATTLAVAERCLAEARALLARAVEPQASLATSVGMVCDQLARVHANDIQVALDVTGEPSAGVAHHLARIVEEAVRNSVRHAGAKTISVEGHIAADRVALVVRDDGNGFDPDVIANGRFGLAGMAARARMVGASLNVSSHPTSSTQVVLRWAGPRVGKVTPAERLAAILARACRHAREGNARAAYDALARADSPLAAADASDRTWMHARLLATQLVVARVSGDASGRPRAAMIEAAAGASSLGAVLLGSECALSAWAEGDVAGADAWLARASAVAVEGAHDDATRASLTLRRAQGNVLLARGDGTAARRAFEDTVLLARLLGDRWEESIGLYNMAEALSAIGDIDRAKLTFARSIPGKLAIRDRWGLAYVHHGLAHASLVHGNAVIARRHFRAMQRTMPRVNDPVLRRLYASLVARM